MNDSVAAAFSTFNKQYEGLVDFLYVDVKNLVTIGIGNLVDPIGLALVLPFVHKDDGVTPSSSDEIAADWTTVKGDPALGPDNPLARAGHTACAPLTQQMLTRDAIDSLVRAKAEQNATVLRQTAEFAGLDTWPADAQLGLFSMAWAMGPAFGPGFPTFRAACGAQDWTAAAAACHMADAANPGLRPRNVADEVLFADAAFVVAQGLDATVLQYVPADERPPLRQGSAGPDLDFLQGRLVTLGYLPDASGSFDGATADAVRQLQSEHGLPADGVVGAQTWAATGTCVPAA